MLTVVPGDGSGHEGGKGGSPSLIDEIVREGARRMLAEALQAEVDAYIAAHAAEHDENGRRLVVRNGHHQPREVLTSAGAVEVTVPRVNDKRTDLDTGERKRFSSAILPPWARKTPKITEVLPLLYLHGLSSGDFVPCTASKYCGGPDLRILETVHAARWYSFITPPSTLRRRTGISNGTTTGSSCSGGRCCRDWCGRCPLK